MLESVLLFFVVVVVVVVAVVVVVIFVLFFATVKHISRLSSFPLKFRETVLSCIEII